MANLGYIQVVRTCNQRCRFCSNPDKEVSASLDELEGRVDDLVERGYDGIILTGGEPTLCPDLPHLIRHAVGKGIAVRMITNGQNSAEADYAAQLVEAGLRHVHVSVHSNNAKLQGWLAGKEDSLECIERALDNFVRLGVNVDINITIQHYNADHLDRIVRWLVAKWPVLRHFVFNNLDPTSDRVAQHPDCVPKLHEMEIALARALSFLQKSGRTFRVERVPLCYMVEFAWASTETRKIVKNEERIVHFLDERGTVHQTSWEHGKAQACAECRLNSICAGLFEMDRFYSSDELYPVHVDPDIIRKLVLAEAD